MSSPAALRDIPKKTAISGEMILAGIGLEAVLAIRASSFLSIHWLRAAAPPAANAVPIVGPKTMLYLNEVGREQENLMKL